MTDPEMADATYIEPDSLGSRQNHCEKRASGCSAADQRPDRAELRAGAGAAGRVLEEFGVNTIGATADAIG